MTVIFKNPLALARGRRFTGGMAAVKTASIYAVIGTDDVEVKRVAKELSVKLGAGGDFGADIIDGQVENADQAAQRVYQAIEAIQTFGFFGGEKLVWLKNANFLADDRTGGAGATVEAVEKLTEVLDAGMPDGTRFLLSAGSVDKRRSFYKKLSKFAEVQVFDKLDNTKSGWEESASLMVRTMARERGLQLDGEPLELFTLFTGGDRRTIQNLEVVQSRAEDGVLVIKGSVPGATNSYLIIRPAIKQGAVAKKQKQKERAAAAAAAPKAKK